MFVPSLSWQILGLFESIKWHRQKREDVFRTVFVRHGKLVHRQIKRQLPGTTRVQDQAVESEKLLLEMRVVACEKRTFWSNFERSFC
jgi:hypothetical protein